MFKPGYEKVHTVTDYFDGPREGIADLGGKPHFYRCEWDATSDVWQPFYLLQPLDESAFRLALEDWEIWERWDAAFHQGRTTLNTHPALPDDRARHNELAAILAQRLVIHPAAAIKAVGEFEPIGPKLENHWIAPLQVKWTLVLDATANTPLDRTKPGLEL